MGLDQGAADVAGFQEIGRIMTDIFARGYRDGIRDSEALVAAAEADLRATEQLATDERERRLAAEAERDEARLLYDAALRDHVTLIHQCEAAEAEVKRLTDKKYTDTIPGLQERVGFLVAELESCRSEVARLTALLGRLLDPTSGQPGPPEDR